MSEAQVRTISVTRALSQIKTLKARIADSYQGTVIGVTRGTDDRKVAFNMAMSVADLSDALVSNVQQQLDFITQLRKLEAALVAVNANSTIVVNKQTMTVAEAIKRKQTIGLEQNLVAAWKRQYQVADQQVGQLRNQLEQEIDRSLTTVYGNEKGKITVEQSDAVAAPKRQVGEPALLDPNKILEKIKEYEDDIRIFLEEVDFLLSEFNAKTEIVIG